MNHESDIREAILASASENSSLLVRLASTSEAPSTFRAQVGHVSHLRNTLAEHTRALKILQEEVESLSKTHKKFRDSLTRRFFYRSTRMLDKFESKARKAESEYFTALGTQSKLKERQTLLERDYKEAILVEDQSKAAAKEHDEIHGQIDSLYNTLFTGPTPGFPHEDEREHIFYNARAKNEAVKERIMATRRVAKLLKVSQMNIKRAQKFLESAQRGAEDSLLFFNDTFNSLRRGNEKLDSALMSVNTVEEHLGSLSLEMSSAQRAFITYLEAAKINTEYLDSRDVILSEVRMAIDNISASELEAEKLADLIKERERDALSEIKGTARQLEDTRQELQQIRQGIFEEVAGFGEAAPAYTECCDRANGYCDVGEEFHEHELELGVGTGTGAERQGHPDNEGHDPPKYHEASPLPSATV